MPEFGHSSPRNATESFGRRRGWRLASGLLGVGLVAGLMPVAIASAAPAPHPAGHRHVASGRSSGHHVTPNGGVLVTTQHTKDGVVLFAAGGQALYQFSADTVGTSTSAAVSKCDAACEVAWPPLLAPTATGPFITTRGARRKDLGTIKLPNGSYQVTYAGHPLYEFIKDTKPGEIVGENIGAFNGIWHLTSIDGRPDAGRAMLTLEQTPEGVVLGDVTGFGLTHTLYMLTTDPYRKSTCVGACTAIWPPLLSRGKPMVGPGIDRHLVGTIRRPDGTRQVTYEGHPLYFFEGDLSPTTVPGNAGEDLVDPFAHGVWYEVGASGLPQAGQITVTSTSVTLPGATGSQSVLAVDSQLGTFAVYGYTADTQTKSACVGKCAVFWPPVITSRPPTAGSGVNAAELGTIERPNGTFQVTYDGHPLYYFAYGMPGSTSGEGIMVGKGTFELVSTSGMLIPKP